MPVLVLFLCLIGNYYTYHSKGDLVQVKEEIYSQGELISTPVPNTGYVSDIYFNTSLSVEEVVSLLSSLTLVEVMGDTGYILLNDESGTGSLIVATTMDGIWGIIDFTTDVIFFISSDVGFGFVGWNPDISYPYSINANVSNILQGANVGNENYSISSLFSITPFEYAPGELLRTETKYLTFEEYIGEEYTKPSELINGQYINSLSINTDLTENQLLDYFQYSLDISNNEGISLFDFDSFGLGVIDLAEADMKEGCILAFVDYSTGIPTCLYCPSFLYSRLTDLPDLLSEFNISNPGWNNLDLFPLEINSSDYTFDESINNLPLFVTTPVVVSTLEKVNLSFFDITLIQTDNTFVKFQLPFLRNAFDSVFNILNFESNYVSSFVLTSFTWMIQLLLLHVVVDTLAFIFKMYHKLMDKVV